MTEVNSKAAEPSPGASSGTQRRSVGDVRRWFDDGIPMVDAIRIAVGGSVREFVLGQEPPLRTTPQNAAAMVAGRRPVADDLAEALARELDATPAEIRELIWLGARPKELAVAS